ncbi:hypothetical protein N7519_000386 [Penicillium mononematosum]|uniref:uncharacterized protein n=1 Tax=Penicillium mononematosum TaxID=268346 RepID=UPI002548A5B5|nr:uncharacterized protein N7519_000386 [Penicillium mononematosum]KAJ6190365.1 hypothetical protein N7519_000386 [Penicillium mononematosum]
MGENGGESPVRSNTPTNPPLYGVGAPADRDWDAVEDAIGDQGDGLPAVGSFVLYKLFPPLKHKEHFDIWFQIVTLILESHGLHRLIDKSIERPMRNSQNAETWKELSLQVREWLRRSIDRKVVQEITTTGRRTKWADDFMHECKLHMHGEGHGALQH